MHERTRSGQIRLESIRLIFGLLLLAMVTSGCVANPVPDEPAPGSGQPTAASTLESNTLETSDAITAAVTATADIPATDSQTPPAQAEAETDWLSMPIVPTVSPRMKDVFERGQKSGRDAARFSKIGDCQNITTYFLAMYDSGNYRLGDQYAYLQPTIDHFKGSWWRQSLSVKGGMNVAAVLSPIWANPDKCLPKETPLACELRVYNPAFAVISLEESWSGSIEHYDMYLREIVEYVLAQDIVPILATRAETETQERQINPSVARIAHDYQVPLWNFGAAARALLTNGIRPDGFHITEGQSYFDDEAMLKTGWTQRNLTALQAIDAVYRGLTQEP